MSDDLRIRLGQRVEFMEGRWFATTGTVCGFMPAPDNRPLVKPDEPRPPAMEGDFIRANPCHLTELVDEPTGGVPKEA